MIELIKRRTVGLERRKTDLSKDKEVMVRCKVCNMEFKTTVGAVRGSMWYGPVCKACLKKRKKKRKEGRI